MRFFKDRRESRKRAKLTAIDELIGLLNGSEDSAFAVVPVAELIELVTTARRKIDSGESAGDQEIRDLFVPTGALQDTAIDNGWGDRFIELAGRLC